MIAAMHVAIIAARPAASFAARGPTAQNLIACAPPGSVPPPVP